MARYRDRHSVARKKSDAGDALVLANILRTDLPAHRPLPADTELARAIRVLARAQQDAVWDRTTLILRLRSLLREYYPGILTALAHTKDTLASPVGRTLLAAAPDPAAAAALTENDIAALLVKAGRSRGITAAAQHFQQALHTPQTRQSPLVEQAFAHQALALLRQLDTVIANVQALTEAATEAFAQHPDAGIITSFPGLSSMQGARILGELGDDRTRFTDARALKAYAGSAPVTRASGKNRTVLTRKVKNQRLASAGYQWAFNALAASPGAKAHYQRRREHGDWHNAALRHLFNRQLGILHHCLTTRQTYDETKAFAPRPWPDPAAPPAGQTVERRHSNALGEVSTTSLG